MNPKKLGALDQRENVDSRDLPAEAARAPIRCPRTHRAKHASLRMLALGLLAGFMAPLASADLPGEKDAWIRLETANFTVFSNAGEKKTKRIALGVETLRAALSAVFGARQLQAPLATRIYVFRDEESFQPYSRWAGRPLTKVAGFFYAAPDCNFVAMNADRDTSDPLRTVFHEYIHSVLNNQTFVLPLWLHEGLAELYSTVAIDGDEVEIGRPIFEHVDWLNKNSLIPLDRLMSISFDSTEYNERARIGVFYAQSWAFTHYLLLGKDTVSPELSQYLTLLAEGRSFEDAGRAAFGEHLEPLQKALHRYIRKTKASRAVNAPRRGTTSTSTGGRPRRPAGGPAAQSPPDFEQQARDPVFRRRKVPIPNLRMEDKLEISAMSREQTLTELGELLVHLPAQAGVAAESHFNAALRINASYASAISGLGFARQRESPQEAEEHFRRALALALDDASIHFRLGSAILDQVLANQSGPMRGRMTEARDAFRRALELQPDWAPALAGLGSSYLLDEAQPPEEATDALERAVSLMPSRSDFALDLALLWSKRGNCARVDSLYQKHIRPKVSAVAARQIRVQLWRLAMSGASLSVEAGRYDLAADVYQHLGASVDDEDVRAQLDSELRATERVLSAQVHPGNTTPRTELAAEALTRIRETLARLDRES